MNFSAFFIKNPIFAWVCGIFICLGGAIAFVNLPISQYPEILPASVTVRAQLSGASPQVLADTVLAPLEQEINGVEGMLFMQSQGASDGSFSIDVTFRDGVNPDLAQVLVQNRVSAAMPRLPETLQHAGISVRKRSSDQLAAIHLYSTDRSRDTLYLTNYAISQMVDRLARIPGISEVTIFGSREYSIRIWLDPNKLRALNLSVREVISEIQNQNREVLAGRVNSPRMSSTASSSHELLLDSGGKLKTAKDFEDIVVKKGTQGKIVKLKDLGTVELGSYNYDEEFYRDGAPAMGIAIYQVPGSNGLHTMELVKSELAQMEKDLPDGVECFMTIDNTEHIQNTIKTVYRTLIEACGLVVLVVVLFLHSFRSAFMPIVAMVISIVGTFIFIKVLGLSINTLTLFGLVLSTGIVVDDAIVVVELISQKVREGVSGMQAAFSAMRELQSALIGIAVVLSCVFIPTAFLPGVSGEFYRQFALTIAGSTIISAFVSLSLVPALSARLCKPSKTGGRENAFAGRFEKGMSALTEKYTSVLAAILNYRKAAVLVYLLLLAATAVLYIKTPQGFIPRQDNGYLSVSLQLPEGLALDYTDKLVQRAQEALKKVNGIEHQIAIAGQSGATRAKASNAAVMIIKLKSKPSRIPQGESLEFVMKEMERVLKEALPEASVLVLAPPAVMGIGAGGDFQFYVQDRMGVGTAKLVELTQKLTEHLREKDSISAVFSPFRADSPQISLDIDREKAALVGVDYEEVAASLQYYLGSVYINDFNYLNRVFRVVAQAGDGARNSPEAISEIWVKNKLGSMVSLEAILSEKVKSGAQLVTRYNIYPSASVMGNLAEGASISEAIEDIEKAAQEILPSGVGIEWTDMVLQQKLAGHSSTWIFALCLLCVYLSLAALYESWKLPLVITLIVPLVLLFGLIGLRIFGLDNSLLSQIGFVVLIGLACKNSILIVEFASEKMKHGLSSVEAAVEAARARLRPILMTSVAFLCGVTPMMLAQNYGSELQVPVGVTVFFGMLGVTIVGLFLTPTFFVALDKLHGRPKKKKVQNR
ncbi:efflux RND transporter permease subunit [Parasutterella excrementihominis]|uniref:efflux RND transporter permease subunit n=1 Tax=Parasutterella excrementihominis TaxID=487175 RepID=UPI00242E6429|nr:efflux RND transporter permease subunit [Parasutterella excrementihominis]